MPKTLRATVPGGSCTTPKALEALGCASTRAPLRPYSTAQREGMRSAVARIVSLFTPEGGGENDDPPKPDAPACGGVSRAGKSCAVSQIWQARLSRQALTSGVLDGAQVAMHRNGA